MAVERSWQQRPPARTDGNAAAGSRALARHSQDDVCGHPRLLGHALERVFALQQRAQAAPLPAAGSDPVLEPDGVFRHEFLVEQPLRNDDRRHSQAEDSLGPRPNGDPLVGRRRRDG